KYMAKVVPGLRPWEVLTMEQIMDKITYAGGIVNYLVRTIQVYPLQSDRWIFQNTIMCIIFQ
ncbi:hypothetical protein KI387_037225, partial [Taxus chinensis]